MSCQWPCPVKARSSASQRPVASSDDGEAGIGPLGVDQKKSVNR
jgi:hypothetical protein